MLSLISSKSRGGDISDVNLAIVQSIAKQILDFHELRQQLEEHVESEMQDNCTKSFSNSRNRSRCQNFR